MTPFYDVTILTVRPGTHPQALAILGKGLGNDPDLLACWYSDIGAVNQILIIRKAADAGATVGARFAALDAPNPFGVAEYIAAMAMDIYVPFDFIAPLRPGEFGPCYEVRSYVLKPDGLAPTTAAWRKAVPGRMAISPVLAAMTSVTGAVTRFMHIWPYRSFDERARLRDKAVADGVWPPPGGPGHLVSQQADIYLPAPFSPMK
ncbi:MAG TPA: NIPSNAP family protein [Xanthobacteraceae bacterium]|nr:NIPSNAP family protein [Xanthobacteraceae bacterium]